MQFVAMETGHKNAITRRTATKLCKHSLFYLMVSESARIFVPFFITAPLKNINLSLALFSEFLGRPIPYAR